MWSGDGSGDGSGGSNNPIADLVMVLGSLPLDRSIDDPSNPLVMFTQGAQEGFAERWWSPELRAQLILSEFAAGSWQDIKLRPPVYQDSDKLAEQITDLVNKRVDRGRFLPEILAQSNDFTNYFLHVLMADSGRRPYTASLIQAGIAIGTMVAMHWKRYYNCARPSQYYPALMPVIPVPPHPSYPSGHSLQSHLIRHLIVGIFEDPTTRTAMDDLLEPLADRIARNREFAGVHFSEDSDKSKALAADLRPLLLNCSTYEEIASKAQAEWVGVGAGARLKPEDLNKWESLAQEVVGLIKSTKGS